MMQFHPARIRALRCSVLTVMLTAALTACATAPYRPLTLNGKVAVATRVTLPRATTMVRLRLLDTAGSGGAASLLAEQFINRPASFPVPFALQYDRAAIRADGNYQVDTEVYAAGALTLHDQHPLKIRDGLLPDDVTVTVHPVGE